jgi:hypothetical protein
VQRAILTAFAVTNGGARLKLVGEVYQIAPDPDAEWNY